jgi:hypothetical protein
MKQTTRNRLTKIESFIRNRSKEPDIQEAMIQIAEIIRRRDTLNENDPGYPTDRELAELINSLYES